MLLWMVGCVLAAAVYAQDSAALDHRVNQVLAQMASKDLATRNAGFDNFVKVITEGQQVGFDPQYSDFLAPFLARHPGQAERVKVGLINLLQSYDDTFMDRKTAPGTYTENDSEHWAQAIAIVASLEDDRAIPGLVGAMTTGGMASAGVGKYGQKALGPVLRQLNNPDPLVRSTAVSMAITILRMRNDPTSQTQIVDLIRTAIRDPEFLIRSAALYQIDNLSSEKQLAQALQEFVPVLQQMAQQDPFFIPDQSGQNHYLLEDKAQRLLEKIANH